MRTYATILVVLAAFLSTATAQFGFFDQMFGGGGQQQRQQPQNVPSDSSVYRQNFDSFTCDNYLCPDTLGEYIFIGKSRDIRRGDDGFFQ